MARYDLPISFIKDHGFITKSLSSMRPPLSKAIAPRLIGQLDDCFGDCQALIYVEAHLVIKILELKQILNC